MSMTDIAEVALPLDQLNECREGINKGMEMAALGMLETARQVATATKLIHTSCIAANKTDKDAKKMNDEFFSSTNLGNDAATKSKLLKIANHIEKLDTHKDDIPQNFTAYYMLASNEIFMEKLEDRINSNDDKRRLHKDLSIKQLKNLIEGREFDVDAASPPAVPAFMTISYKDKTLTSTLHDNKATIEDRINKVLEEVTGSSEFQFKISPKVEKYTPPKPRVSKKKK
tara:strand:- start:1718 stop:2401 length:684 start_codon:yes stop_codon:yes gene_type:complete